MGEGDGKWGSILALGGVRTVAFGIDMDWAKREHPREEIDAAGETLINRKASPEEFERALPVINNWRACHAFPLNTFQIGLRNKARQVYRRSLVAQRIKRLPAIELKLRRLGWLRLSDMQDIGGCRAVVGSVRSVNELVKVYKSSRIKHELDDEDNYILAPKRTGYRGIHLIYRYHSDRSQAYEGLKIEMQIRSRLQHAWATAVETVDAFTRQALKSNLGDKDWLRFFALMGTAIAIREKSPPVPDTPTKRAELVDELREYAHKLDVQGRLTAYRDALSVVRHPALRGARYFLLELDPHPTRSTIKITPFKRGELERASKEYLSAERTVLAQPGLDAVLVSVESVRALRHAYPNYFLDTRVLLEELKQVLRRG